MTRQRFGPYTVEVSREDKVLFPEEGLTKGDLLAYYQSVAPVMLPHLKDRPLTLQRFPDGVEEEGFYQKVVPDYFPEWISRARVPLSEGGSQTQVVAANTATLAYLANQATITPHIWLSRADQLKAPDRLVFDLDPWTREFSPVREGALALREILEALGMTPFFMTTGGSGGHVWVPIRRDGTFQEARELAGSLAQALARDRPETFTTEVRKDARKGRLYLDVSRNAYGQTAVAPYAVRAHSGAPVATPLEWAELEAGGVSAQSHTLRSIPRRLGQKEDPWRGMGNRAVSLSRATQRWQHKMEDES